MTVAATLVTNPSSGGGRSAEAAQRVLDALRAHGWRVRAVRSRDAEDAVRIGAEADPDEVVVSLGGDGTHALVARGVLGSGALLAPLPGGRGNDLVRALGAPHDPVQAALSLGTAVERRVDVGLAGGTPYLGVLSIGYSASASRIALESKVRGPFAYHLAALRALRERWPREYVLTVDGVERRWIGVELAVGSSGWYGGGLQVCPGAVLDDGLLDVTCVTAPRRQLPRLLSDMFSGTHVRRPGVQVFRARQLRVAGEGEVWADGDRLGELPLSVEVRPSCLRVLA